MSGPSGSRAAFAVLAAIGIGWVTGCSGGEESPDAAADTLTRRQRDSLIGESVIPGARGVRGALRAQDSAAARARRADSIGGSPR